MISLEDFIIKQKKKKTVIMIPKNEYLKFIDERINQQNLKITKYLNIILIQKF